MGGLTLDFLGGSLDGGRDAGTAALRARNRNMRERNKQKERGVKRWVRAVSVCEKQATRFDCVDHIGALFLFTMLI